MSASSRKRAREPEPDPFGPGGLYCMTSCRIPARRPPAARRSPTACCPPAAPAVARCRLPSGARRPPPAARPPTLAYIYIYTYICMHIFRICSIIHSFSNCIYILMLYIYISIHIYIYTYHMICHRYCVELCGVAWSSSSGTSECRHPGGATSHPVRLDH